MHFLATVCASSFRGVVASPSEPNVLNFCQLLLALSGQFISYTPEWQTAPEVILAPRMPTPFDSWSLATTPRFAFARTDWNSDGSVAFQDTVILSWQAAGRVFEEIHLGSERTMNRPAKTWVRAFGVDTMRAKKGQAAADSMWKWNRLEGPEPWIPEEVLRCRDTLGGRSCVDSSYWVYQDTLRKDARWIREKVDAHGYMVRRDTIMMVNGSLKSVAIDSQRVESNGKPLEQIHWSYSWGDDSLIQDIKTENVWNGSRLERVKTHSSSVGEFERILYWGINGRLDSSVIPGLQNGYRFQYDSQGRMIGQTTGSLRNRMDLDANGRLVALHADLADNRNLARYREFALDSFILDPQGRLMEAVNCLDYSTDSLIHRSKCTRRTYDYNVSVSLRQPARVRAVGQVRLQEGALVGIGQAGRRTTLHVLAPNGKSIARASGEGQAVLAREALPDGLVVWQMEVDGAAWGGGKAFLPRR